jgi:hypothetical protein
MKWNALIQQSNRQSWDVDAMAIPGDGAMNEFFIDGKHFCIGRDFGGVCLCLVEHEHGTRAPHKMHYLCPMPSVWLVSRQCIAASRN